jgi:hypothetical protein
MLSSLDRAFDPVLRWYTLTQKTVEAIPDHGGFWGGGCPALALRRLQSSRRAELASCLREAYAAATIGPAAYNRTAPGFEPFSQKRRTR